MKKMVLRVLSIMMIAAIMVISTNSVAALAAENLDISSRVFVSDAAPADNADGSITFSEQKSMKCSFALPTVLNAGESVTVNVKLQFDSADDAGDQGKQFVRSYCSGFYYQVSQMGCCV